MYYVYILKGKKYYCGHTNNLKRRLQEHKRWKTITTKLLQINVLVWYFILPNEIQARDLEKKIKDSWHIERWINNENFISFKEKLM